MPSGRSKRKNDKKAKSNKCPKVKRPAESQELEMRPFTDGCDVVSSILEEGRKDDDKLDDDIASIASDTLLCLEEVYCDTHSTSQSPIDSWTTDINAISLVIGEGEVADSLKHTILEVTSCHDVVICKQEDSFETCNTKGLVLIWFLMEMPVGPDILSLTTSIRYASKYNRNTMIMGVANTTSTVDLRLHGIDEIVLHPVEGNIVRQKYSKWTSVTIVPVDLDSPETEVNELSSSTATLPQTTANATEKREKCAFSISVNNSTGQLSLAQIGGFNMNMMSPTTQCTNSTSQSTAGKKRHNSSTDHTTKEKVRRERIKDSCDQLRVLLPYIRGRKTDMASILEMCVDYLRLVNAALPQEFQNQIVDILARDSAVTESPNSEKKNKSKKPETDTNLVTSTVDTDMNNNDVKPNINALGYQNGEPEKIEDNDPLVCAKPTKRFRIQADNFMSPQSPCITTGVSYESNDQRRLDQDQAQSSYSFNSGHHYYDYDLQNFQRSYNTLDPFSGSFYGQSLPSKQNDRDAFGMYMEPQTYFPFYSSNSLCAYGLPQVGPDYVNPNAVLPISSHSNQDGGGGMFEEHNSSLSSQSSQMSTGPEDCMDGHRK